MEKKEIDFSKLSEPLPVSSLDFRVQSISKKGYAIILPYKDARVDMNRLDDVCGHAKWKREHKRIDGGLFCTVSIRDPETNEWVSKEDIGTPSNTEEEKGEASDSFKRACFNWGIGRELYDYPLIMVKLNEDEYEVDEKGKAKQTWNLKLKEWKWYVEFDENRKVKLLAAKDQGGNGRFKYEAK